MSPQDSYVEAPTYVTVFRDGAFKEVSKAK